MAQLHRHPDRPGVYTGDVGPDRYIVRRRVRPTWGWWAMVPGDPVKTFTRRTLAEVRRELGRRQQEYLASRSQPAADQGGADARV